MNNDTSVDDIYKSSEINYAMEPETMPPCIYGPMPPEPEMVVKYGPMPAPDPDPEMVVKYGPMPAPDPDPEMVVKYGPMPAPDPDPEMVVKYGPMPAPEPEPEIVPKYGPMPAPEPEPASPVIPAIPVVTDVKDAEKLIEELGLVIEDIEKFHNNSFYVTGEFGKAITYSSESCQQDLSLLNKYTENNLLKAMKCTSEYDYNFDNIKKILKPIESEYGEIRFTSDGKINIQFDKLDDERYLIISNAEELYKRNMEIKKDIDSLSNEAVAKETLIDEIQINGDL